MGNRVVHDLYTLFIAAFVFLAVVIIGYKSVDVLSDKAVKSAADKYANQICLEGITTESFASFSGYMASIDYKMEMTVNLGDEFLSDDDVRDALSEDGNIILSKNDRVEIMVYGEDVVIYASSIKKGD